MGCEDVKVALAHFALCEETAEGARIATHCLYPSFESVRVFVARLGNSFEVHDGGEAFNVAWLHARDEPMIKNSLRDLCSKFRLELKGNTLVAKVDSPEWLGSAIVAVANASSMAAHDAVAKVVAVAEEALFDRMDRILAATVGPKAYMRNVGIRGASGGERRFDFVLGSRKDPHLLLNGVAPHPMSIASKYVAFSDTEFDRQMKMAVHDRDLENDDAVLLQQVAIVVPFASFNADILRLN